MKINHRSKIVTIDIETAPILAYIWKLWKENIGLNQISSEWFILSFTAKWLDSNEVVYMDMRNNVNSQDDTPLLQKLWEILNEADIVIGQNNVRFDQKKINARLIMNGFPPPSPYKIVDTYLMAKQKFSFTSNRLAWLSEHLSDVSKDDHSKFPGFELWAECLKDNPEAWDEMEKYNVKDVLATEQVYLKLRAWIDGHPNVVVNDEEELLRCHRCGSSNIHKRGFTYTNSGKYQRFVCSDCKGWSRSRYTLNSTEKRKSLLM